MKYCVLPSYIWTYPDIHNYPKSADRVTLLSLRGGYASFQLHIYETSGEKLLVKCCGFSCEKYKIIPIAVESCPGIQTPLPHFPERKAPFLVGDCLMPIEDSTECTEHSTGIYFAIPIPYDAANTIQGSITVTDGTDRISVPVSVEVSSASLPPELLKIGMGCDFIHMAKYHDVKSKEDFEAVQTQYMSLLRRQHQNMIYIHGPYGICHDGKWEFSFDYFNKFAEKAMSMGFKKLLIHGVGFRRSWDAPDIMRGEIDLLSVTGYKYLDAYLTSMRENLKKQGWLNKDIFYLGLCDEPNDKNAMTYRALASVVRKLIPEIKLYDATSDAPIYGALDIWIPRADEYEKNKDIFDYYRERGDEVWDYVCLFPRENGYINRFLDIPLLATRYLFWGNYRYYLTGYIHWTVNCYQNDCDPFKESCTRHVNAGNVSILPPGDDKLIYPGTDGKGWISLRLENHRESAEEYAMLQTIAAKDRELADSICKSVFRSFNDVEWNAEKFAAARERLIREYEKCSL